MNIQGTTEASYGGGDLAELLFFQGRPYDGLHGVEEARRDGLNRKGLDTVRTERQRGRLGGMVVGVLHHERDVAALIQPVDLEVSVVARDHHLVWSFEDADRCPRQPFAVHLAEERQDVTAHGDLRRNPAAIELAVSR